MPYCTQCGNQIGERDRFCAGCGAAQGAPAHAVPSGDPLGRISNRTAALLCYVPLVGWLAAIIVLASPRFLHDRTMRLHAFQSIYLFVAWLLVEMVTPLLPGVRAARTLESLLHLAIFAIWIYMLVRTAQNQFVLLPVIGELAEKSVEEQRRV